MKEENEVREKLESKVNKTKEKLEFFLSESKNNMKINERINKGIKNLKNEDKNMIKILSYFSKINNNKRNDKKLFSELMKNIKFKYEEDKSKINFEEYYFNGNPKPKNIQFKNITSSSLNISWNIDNININNSEKIKYRIEMRKENEDFIKIYEGNNNNYSINNLIKDTNYEFIIYSFYNNLIESKSEIYKIKTFDINILNDSKRENECINKSNERTGDKEMEVKYMNENNIRYGKIGLKNEEINDYMSSVIQILKNINSFKSIFLERETKENAIKALQKLFNNLYYSKEENISILEFKNEFAKVYKKFEGIQHNDSTFFLIYLLQYLHKSFNQPNSNITSKLPFNDLGLKLSEKDEYEFKNFVVKVGAKNNSFIFDLFYGYQMNKIICTACGNTEVSFQCFYILDLPLMDEKNKLHSLEQCFNYYLITKDQKGIKGFECKKCNRNDLSYSISIIKFPLILIINLKRVVEKNIYYHEIEIPFIFKTGSIEKLYKVNKNYELIGFIKKYGNEMNGHNVAYSKNIFDHKWYYFNDCKVEEVKGYPSTEKTFLLFYQFIDEKSVPISK